jgi:hypothetical protein
VGNEKLIGGQEPPYFDSMNCEPVLKAQNRIREGMNPFGNAVVFRTGIEHQVQIWTQPAFGQVAADHSDAAKAYDAVVMTESSGLDIAKHHGRSRCRVGDGG